MSHPDTIIERPHDIRLIQQFRAADVRHRRLSTGEHWHHETDWRRTFGEAFRHPDLRCRHGIKAVHAFLAEPPGEWLFVPFLSDVPGTPVSVHSPGRLSAFACTGPLLELQDFIDTEFFVSPPDLAWTFVRTHEDFAFGGPYFVRFEWLNIDPTP